LACSANGDAHMVRLTCGQRRIRRVLWPANVLGGAALVLGMCTGEATGTALPPGATVAPSATVAFSGPNSICGANVTCTRAASTGAVPFAGIDSSSQTRFTGTIVQDVFLNTTFDGVTGTSFRWTVENDVNSLDSILRVSMADFGGFLTDVGYVSGSGVPPLSADRSASPGTTVGFANWGSSPGGITPGSTTVQFLIQTNASSFTSSGSTTLSNGASAALASVATYEPAGASVAQCGNGVIEAGEECDDGNTLDGDCCSSSCQFEPMDGPCDDGNACTLHSVCDGSGRCVATGATVSCTPLDQCHDAGTCDPTTGGCSNPPKPDGTSCNDGVSCTGPDSCTAGVCRGPATAGCCTKDADCDDGLSCNGGETCNVSTGQCQPGTPVDCNDRDACTTDACTEPSGTCSHTPIALNPLDVRTLLCLIFELIGANPPL